MPSRENKLRAVEQLLRETIPPAAVTVVYRQRVVQTSLDARLKQLHRRRTRRSLLFGLAAACILLMPLGLVVTALTSSMRAGMPPAEFHATQFADPRLAAMVSTDGGEVLAIHHQLEAREQNWLAAQRSSRQ